MSQLSSSARAIPLAALLVLGGVSVAPAAFPEWTPPGQNIARGKTYAISKAGKCFDYNLSKDEGDKAQLTDGQFAPLPKHMWWYKEAVGWFMGSVGITFDLGEAKAIAGVGFSTDTGSHAGVGCPPARST